MKWELAIVAATVLIVAGVSRRLTGTPVTPAMVFVLAGVLVGPLVIDEVTAAPTGSGVRTLAEATLAIVLFADASRIKPRLLRREYAVPLRLLGIGLPLTIALGAVLAAVMFDQLTVTEAIVLAILLAPTDAALGEAVVTEPRLPSRIRQGLNVESGLNDGICVPLLLIALAAADVEDKAASSHHAITIVVEEIGYGILGGVAAGLAAAALVAFAYRRNLITGSWLQVIPVAGAGLAYGIAAALGGSGFIAAFVAGAIFGALVSQESEQASRLNEELGELLGGVTFLIFGAVLLGPALKHVSWQIALYAVLSLTLVRIVPVAIAMNPHRRPATDRRLPRLVWPERARIDRVRRDRRRGGTPARSRNDPRHHVPDGRTVRPGARNQRRATGPALRPLVRITSARAPAGDGERSRTGPPRARGVPPRIRGLA